MEKPTLSPYLARMKRAICVLILLSMTLHCASRLGVISFLYGNRHDIAFSLGIIEEVPISMCKSDDFKRHCPVALVFVNDDQHTPAVFASAHEIHLYFQVTKEHPSSGLREHQIVHQTSPVVSHWLAPDLSIFHPPC